jgi:hypothetical protein
VGDWVEVFVDGKSLAVLIRNSDHDERR